jgi:anti-anti-sigma regulatory factor
MERRRYPRLRKALPVRLTHHQRFLGNTHSVEVGLGGLSVAAEGNELIADEPIHLRIGAGLEACEVEGWVSHWSPGVTGIEIADRYPDYSDMVLGLMESDLAGIAVPITERSPAIERDRQAASVQTTYVGIVPTSGAMAAESTAPASGGRGGRSMQRPGPRDWPAYEPVADSVDGAREDGQARMLMLHLGESLDITATHSLLDAAHRLHDQLVDWVVIDMRRTRRIFDSGLGLLLMILQSVGSLSRQIVLVHCSPSLWERLEGAGLSARLTIV